MGCLQGRDADISFCCPLFEAPKCLPVWIYPKLKIFCVLHWLRLRSERLARTGTNRLYHMNYALQCLPINGVTSSEILRKPAKQRQQAASRRLAPSVEEARGYGGSAVGSIVISVEE